MNRRAWTSTKIVSQTIYQEILQPGERRAYAPAPIRVDNSYISPLNHPFFTYAQLWICVGGLEILCVLMEYGWFAENMKMKVKGNKVGSPHRALFYATHAFLNIGNLTGFESEATHAIKFANEWISEIHV